MENGKFVKNIFCITISAILLLPIFSYAYSDETTHPALTQEIINLFNKYYPDFKLNEEEKELIMKGSKDEDSGTRPLNHFYDPVHNIGLLVINMSAKKWSQNTIAQSEAGYVAGMASIFKPRFSYSQDYSWDRAIYDYAYGDKERALENLGHILHLVEDMSVPPHVRNDQHLVYVDYSPYEEYTSRFNKDNFKIADELFRGGEKPVVFGSLNEYFDDVALYTNNNFFSKDTTPDKFSVYKYASPEIESEDFKMLSSRIKKKFGYSSSGNIIVRIEDIANKKNTQTKYYIEDEDNLILSSYWNLLSPKAVLSGTGVVKLFFDEVEKEKKTMVLYNKNRSFITKITDMARNNLANVFVVFDDVNGETKILPPPSLPLLGGGDDKQVSGEGNDVVPFLQNEIQTIEYIPQTTEIVEEQENIEQTEQATSSVEILSQISSEETAEVKEKTEGYPMISPGASRSAFVVEEETKEEGEVIENENLLPHPSPPLLGEGGDVYKEENIETPKTFSPLSVVINEVAWMGTSANNPNDEWIELYNNTNEDVDLTNWTLHAEDGEPYIPLSGTIKAKKYYLLERTDDSTISDIQADLIYTGTLSNNGEHLILAYNNGNSTTTIDELERANNWYSGGSLGLISPNGYYSMERRYPNRPSSDSGNLGTAIGEFILNGKDTNGVAIKGTPKAKNSISYMITNGNTLMENKTLTADNSPYLIDRDGLTINEGITLNIEKGVVIKIVSPNEPRIFVKGTIKSNGEKNEPVVFTTFNDDEYGGDMNGDGFSTFTTEGVCATGTNCPVAGSWKNIFIASSSKDSYFNNTVFRYGGRYLGGDPKHKSIVTVDNTDVAFNNSIFENSSTNGLYLLNSNSVVKNNVFRNNKSNVSYSLYITGGGSAIVDNNLFENNDYGVYTDSNSSVSSNIFNGNTRGVIYGRSSSNFLNNSGSNNGLNGIAISGDITKENSTTNLIANPFPYIVNDDNVNVVANSALLMQAGVVMKFGGRSLFVDGRLDVDGEADKKVLFTAIDDDSDGNDALNNGTPTGNIRGYSGYGVYLRQGSTSEIKNADFKYLYTALFYENSPINISNLVFSNNNLAIKTGFGNVIDLAQGITFVDNVGTSTVYLGE